MYVVFTSLILQFKILAVNKTKYCRVELEGQSCFRMKKWLSEKNSIESIAMPAQSQVQVNKYSKTKLFWQISVGILSADLIVTGFEYWIHIEYFFWVFFFNYWNLSKKMSFVCSFFWSGGEKRFLFDQLNTIIFHIQTSL